MRIVRQAQVATIAVAARDCEHENDLGTCMFCQVANARLRHDGREPWPEWKPCACVGKCDARCPCLGSKNFCEKFCACGPSCAIRFLVRCAPRVPHRPTSLASTALAQAH